MKQIAMFANDKPEALYTALSVTPVYTPRGDQPPLQSLFDNRKTARLLQDIAVSDVSPDEKAFLIHAAARHTVFRYDRIADYYASASIEMQALMEQSALVILDVENAILHGFTKASDNLREQYLTEYPAE